MSPPVGITVSTFTTPATTVILSTTRRSNGRTLQLYPGLDRSSYARARVAVQERLDGPDLSGLVCHRGKLLTPEEAPPLAAELRASATSPVVPAQAWTLEDEGTQDAPIPSRPPPGPLAEGPAFIGAGEPIWYEDAGKKRLHRCLVRAGMEQPRLECRHIGRPTVSERPGFAQQLAPVLEGPGHGGVSRRQAARELGIGYATLKRLPDARRQPPEMTPEPSAPPAADHWKSGQAKKDAGTQLPDKIAEH
jgi:hypothetical protein